MTMNDTPTDPAAAEQLLGFGHFIAQTDAVGMGLFIVLVVMSVISWYLIVMKSVTQWLQHRRSQAFLAYFWNASSLDSVRDQVATHGARDPFSHLVANAISARHHHVRYGAPRLEEAGTQQDFLTRTLRKVLDEETARLENGLTTLATIGATAPFVGLFGTVWGVYHALVAIGMTGSGTLDQIAGPVGEALIMTGLGLAVAIPAVMGYNALVRSNRVLLARLDGFAFELLTLLSMGQAMGAESGKVLSLRPGTAPLPTGQSA